MERSIAIRSLVDEAYTTDQPREEENYKGIGKNIQKTFLDTKNMNRSKAVKIDRLRKSNNV